MISTNGSQRCSGRRRWQETLNRITMINRRYAILALAPQVWNEQWVNRQQLLSRIGRHHDVLYSTGGWFVWDRAADAWRTAAICGRIDAADNVWIDESPRYLMRCLLYTS